jgi:hypothetical protein
MLDRYYPTNKYDVKVARYRSRTRIVVTAIGGFFAVLPLVLILAFRASG